ncbi:MAG TPA: GxxExxY protein [Methylomirabilota bacterium]|nr:GxxExxY protein [Methylomirabilota bacterium]
MPVTYKGQSIGEHRLDLVEDRVVVELKSVSSGFSPCLKLRC